MCRATMQKSHVSRQRRSQRSSFRRRSLAGVEVRPAPPRGFWTTGYFEARATASGFAPPLPSHRPRGPTACRFTSLTVPRSRKDFHLQVDSHARRTDAKVKGNRFHSAATAPGFHAGCLIPSDPARRADLFFFSQPRFDRSPLAGRYLDRLAMPFALLGA